MVSYKTKFLLIYIAIVISVFLLLYNLFMTLSQTNVKNISNNNLKEKTFERVQYIEDFFHPYQTTIQSIAKNKYFVEYINHNTHKDIVEHYFLSVKESLPCAMQVRYLDNNGQEDIRVDGVATASKLSTPFSNIVDQNNLQNKKNRDYVKRFSNLKKGEIGISNFDLNMEYGKVQIPKRPVVRIGMRVFDKKGISKGLLIINICLRTLFSEIGKTTLYNIYIIDKDGNYIIHPNKKYGLAGESKYTIFDDFEDDAKMIIQQNEYLTKNIYVSPLKNINNNQGLKIILENKFVEKIKTSEDTQFYFILSAILFAVFLLPLAIYFAKKPDALQEDLQDKIDVISKNVLYSRTDQFGIITDVSDAFCRLSGFKRDELIGSSHNIIRHPDMPKSLFEEMWSNLKNGMPWRGEIKNRKKDGSTYWVYSDIQAKYNEQNQHLGYISVRSDITDRKNFEQQQLQMLEQAKMAAMGEMLSNIAHQWRQPLSVITTIASGVAFKQEYNSLKIEELPKEMDNIVHSAEYLSETIETFRNFLKEKKEKKDICIQNKLDEVLNILKATIKNNDINIINNLSNSELITINMVSGELEQVIINLINNAKDIFIEKNIDERWIKLELEKHNDKVVLTVEDNGGGIPKHILPKIFDAYFTTKHQSIGTGLGLNMSYRIVTESLHGKLYAKNTKNGAKFYIELPTK